MKEQENERQLAAKLVEDFYQNGNAGLVTNISKRNYGDLSVTKEKILKDLGTELEGYQNDDGSDLSAEQKERILGLIQKELWGYGRIDSLIHDKSVSDIKIYSAGNIRKKVYGKRSATGIRFDSDREYEKFVTRLLERNKVNLGTANAIQTFTDTTQEDAILRITAMSGLLTDSGIPCIAIRKVPKEKYTLLDLKDAGMFDPLQGGRTETEEQEEAHSLGELLSRMVESRGILFTGKGASGKTSLMNAMLSEIPHEESVMICQENQELFDRAHPDLLASHVLVNGGDSKVSYTLGDLTRAALLMDLDRVIVGEVKEGSEAAGLSKASMTGHKCWTSVHGESCRMAVDKMADYISQATGYTPAESLKQLTGFEYVVHLKDFHVDEIVRINGWDGERNALILRTVYPVQGGQKL